MAAADATAPVKTPLANTQPSGFYHRFLYWKAELQRPRGACAL